MIMKYLYYGLFLWLIIATVSCTDDKNSDEMPRKVETIDGKDFLQQSIVCLDRSDNFKYRMLGEPLNPADTTMLYIGVKNLAEAKILYKRLFAPSTTIQEDGAKIIATLAGKDGQSQGTVIFTAISNEQEDEVANVSFQGVTLKGVSSLHFILNTAWPYNSISPYKKGDKISRATLADGVQEWICLREAKEGRLGILYHIGKKSLNYGSYINAYASLNPHTREEVEQVVAELNDAKIYGLFWCGERYAYSKEGNSNYYNCPAEYMSDMTAAILEYELFYMDSGIISYDKAKVGDFLLKGGNLLEGSLEPGNCISVVCWIGDPTAKDTELKKEHPNCTHGLAIALQDVDNGSGTPVPMIFCDTLHRYGAVNEDCGYGNSQAYRKVYKKSPKCNVFPLIAIDEEFESAYPAPPQTSGWYLPSDLEFVNLHNIWNELEPQIKKAGGKPLLNNIYWTSTEQAYYTNEQMLIYDWSKPLINVENKKSTNHYVRAILAF